jgi:uncharacterized repeat protein (TIGR01451 family)
VNRSTTPSPWPYTPKANEGVSGTFGTSAFFEGGINISQLIPNAGCFTEFVAETRSSTPFDARLKDFVIGDLDTCVRDVGVVKTPDGGSANAGSNISFSMTVSNLGDTAAENVTLSDTLPDSGLSWSITSQPSGTPAPCSIAGTPQVLSCNFGTIPVGETRTVTISSATDVADCGTKNNTVTVSATGDIDATNNTDTGSITVNCGAIRINKNSSKDSTAVNNAGAVFSITGAGITGTSSVTDDLTAAAPDEDANVGRICVSGLQPGATYTVNETTPPNGYAAATQTNQTVVAVAGSCSSTGLNAATFSNSPLGEITAGYNDGGSNETSATSITCKLSGAATDLTAQAEASDDDITGYDLDKTFTVTAPATYVCTVVVDP